MNEKSSFCVDDCYFTAPFLLCVFLFICPIISVIAEAKDQHEDWR